MRSHHLIPVAVALTACARPHAAAFVPTVVVRGGAARAGHGGAVVDRERWRWSVGVEARWSWARPTPAPEDVVRPLPAWPPRGACLDAAICAWEARARARAWRRVEERVHR